VEPAQGSVHQQLRGRHGTIGYSHGPGNGEAEQGETLRKYMRRFFDKRATVVDVTDKEVIDLF
jgi:hypothetical protein